MSSAGFSPLGELALARGTVDRMTKRRTDKDWIEAAWKDPRSRVLAVDQGHALVREDADRVELIFVSPEEAPSGTRFLLGQDEDGVVYFGVSGPLPGGQEAYELGIRKATLREVGALLPDRDAGLLTHAVALANWHDTHTHCPLCGSATFPDPAGQDIAVDHEELAEAQWVSREDLLAALKSRELALPPRVSIARHIIEAWYGGPLPSAWTGPPPPPR